MNKKGLVAAILRFFTDGRAFLFFAVML